MCFIMGKVTSRLGCRRKVASWLNAAAAARRWWRRPAGAAAQGKIGGKLAGNLENLNMGVSENVGKTPKPNGFADHYPY